MTLSALLLGICLAGAPQLSSEPLSATATATQAETPELSRFRLPWELLIDRTVGTASKPVRFDWRKTDLQLAIFGAQPAEFNNYNTFRAGLLARIPTKTLMFELGFSYAWVWGTESSRQLALTPFRQPGRPSRFELDFSVGVPLAEGVVTAWPGFFPAAQLVFSAYFNLRYLIYPGGFSGMKFRDILGASFSPKITDSEVENLDDRRLPGMEVDTQRYALSAGLGTDIYFDFGVFVAPRILIGIPLFAAVAESKMRMSLEFSLAAGYAF